LLERLGEPHPAFELGFRWLEATRPTTSKVAVVHGDFRLGNLLVDPSGLRAVLDWELAHLGDPLEDLGWFCVRAWRFGSPLPAGGVATREELVRAYESAAGTTVDLDALRWWEVLGTLKWGVICIMQAWGP
jgi:aminoglycoside phosphotransferase (APT) family kinase protein